jgi:prepilin-type N-terminal cleavage/methylation domain-containing protein
MDLTMSQHKKHVIDRARYENSTGFSLLELMVVVAITLVFVSLTVSSVMAAVHTSRLSAAGTDLSGLFQQARMRAVQDDRYYSVYQITTNSLVQEFVDIYPQNVNGASGSGGTTLDPKDPSMAVSFEVALKAKASAPNTSNLLQQFLGSNPSSVVPLDGSTAASPVTFGPQGLPCTPVSVSGGTVCNSRGGPTAYWVFFQSTATQKWEAVTVTPAGRIQKWYYAGSVWAKL